MKTHKIKDISALRSETLSIVTDLRSRKLKPAEAKEMSNAVGKAIGTVRVELDYAALRKEKPSIEFLDTPATLTARAPKA